MLLRRLEWDEDFDPDTLTEDSEDEGEVYVVLDPTWQDVWDAFARLDGWIYPSMHLSLHKRRRYPCMSIMGGPEEYAVSLDVSNGIDAEWGNKSIHYLDPRRADELYTNKAWRGVGRAYSNLEIGEVFFTPDRELVVKLIDYFANTGEWHPDVPYVEEICGEFAWTDVPPTSMWGERPGQPERQEPDV